MTADAISENVAALLAESAKVPPADVRLISLALRRFFKEPTGAEHWPRGLRNALCDLFRRANLHIDADLWIILQKPTTFCINVDICSRMRGLLETLRDAIERGDVRPSPREYPLTTPTDCEWPLLATADDLVEGIEFVPRLHPEVLCWIIALVRSECSNYRITFDGRSIQVWVASRAGVVQQRIAERSDAMRTAGRTDLMPDNVVAVQADNIKV